MTQLNDAVRHVLTLKYLAGMFSNPFQGSDARVQKEELTPANLAAARTIGRRVDGAAERQQRAEAASALPLSKSTASIAVVGPLADDAIDQLGPDVPIGYDTNAADLKTKDKIVSVLDGIKAAAPSANVTYAQGCDTGVHRTRAGSAPRSAPRRPRT